MLLDGLDLPNFLLHSGVNVQEAAADGCYLSALLGTLASPETGSHAIGHTRKKRRRRKPRSCKNKEEAENQRMMHIAVERNRRRQMNDHLAVLRSLMPKSYIQRGDQASIVGGAIDFVKELEQLLQSLEVRKRAGEETDTPSSSTPPFAQFFTHPQYVWCQHGAHSSETHAVAQGVADVEVMLVETHASLRILSPRRAGQLVRMVLGLQALQLTILHLGITTLDAMVLFSINAKVEESCSLTTVDDIAAAIHHMLALIEAEAVAVCNHGVIYEDPKECTI